MKKFTAIALLVLFSIATYAQRSLTEGAFENGRWSIAAELGLNLWDGDFNPSVDQMVQGMVRSPLLGLSAEYNVSPLLGAGLMMGGYFINQSDVDEKLTARGIYVAPYLSTDIFGLLNAEKLNRWSFWLSAGIGILNPIRTRYTRYPMLSPGVYGPASPVIVNTPPSALFMPVSLTLERKINSSLSIGLTARFNVSNTDDLDGSVRGAFNDHFETASLSLRHRILPECKQHFRDVKFVYQSPYIRAINENINKIDDLKRKVEELEKLIINDK